MENRLVWINEVQFLDPKFDEFREQHQFDWAWWHKITLLDDKFKYYSFLPRFNSNSKLCPWNNHLGQDQDNYFKINTSIPAKSIENICEIRAKEFLQIMKDRQLPLMVHWSGGIDSTLVMVAILNNFPAEELKNVVVALNVSSIKENERFFIKHILGKFELVDASHWLPDRENLQNYIHVSGQYADQLFPTGRILNQDRETPGIALTPLAGVNCAWADRIIEDANCKGIILQNLGDLYWWISFNYRWAEMDLKDILELTTTYDSEQFVQYKLNHLHWFKTDDFQQWSLCNVDRSSKLSNKLYKTEFKRYIYQYDRNADYFINKPKIGSSRAKTILEPAIFGFLDNGNTVNINSPDIFKLLDAFYSKTD